MNRTKASLLVLSLTTLAVLIAACGGSGSSSSTSASGGSGGDEPTTIRYQTAAGLISPLEVADSLGYLGNLELKSVGSLTGGPESVQTVATDQADITGPVFPGALLKAIRAGADVKAVIGIYGSDEKSYVTLEVLDGSPIHDAKDLVGKKVGVSTHGGTFEAWTKIWLRKEGLSQSEIEEVDFASSRRSTPKRRCDRDSSTPSSCSVSCSN
jgi:ABC-type nitrate/sulfonate/bicarbonate transport system substrate-binding protein